MIAVIFEVKPEKEHRDMYFDIAKSLKPLLEQIDGFISVERFQSLTDPDKFLSLSFWRDEAAVQQWRNTAPHRLAQALGRKEVFEAFHGVFNKATAKYTP
jgi:heme-degrading monooxygenase HmoA